MNVVIVEDHAMFREALRKVCVVELGHTVVGETGSGAAAVPLILKLKPDVVILDLGLPELDGFAVMDRVKLALPSIPILVVSCHVDEYTIFKIEHSPAHGFIDKGAGSIAMFKEAILAIASGKTYFSAAYQSVRRIRRTDPRSFAKILSEAELQILSLVGLGLNDLEIARRLGIAQTTAQTHRSRILQKLHIKGTPKLVAFAIRHGFSRI